MLTDNTTPAPETCQLPGCDNLIESHGGPGQRKRFCCDLHRLQFWRQTRSEQGESTRRPPPDAQPNQSPAVSQLEQSVQLLEGVLTQAHQALAELDQTRAALRTANERLAASEQRLESEERHRHELSNAAPAKSSTRVYVQLWGPPKT
jgi:exonuclease VII small subunit